MIVERINKKVDLWNVLKKILVKIYKCKLFESIYFIIYDILNFYLIFVKKNFRLLWI